MSGALSRPPSRSPLAVAGRWLFDHARGVLLVCALLVALPYVFATPIFEKNDEVWHFAFVKHLADGGDLPVQRAGEQTAWLQIGSQPPLYYALASLVVRAFDTSDFDAQSQPNQAPQYNPYWPGNKNMLLITPQKRPFGYDGSTLAALVLRLIGLGPLAVTVWFAWAVAEAISRRRSVTIVATALVAFNPMYLTVATAVSNDGLVIALSTVGLYLLARWVMGGGSWRLALVTGVVIGCAALAKVSGAVLLPVALAVPILAYLFRDKQDKADTEDTEDTEDKALSSSSSTSPHTLTPSSPHPFTPSSAQPLVVLLPFLAITGWWFWRNVQLYSDPTGTNAMAAVAGTRNLSVWQALGEFQGFRMSYLAMFGQFNVPTFDAAYAAWDVLLIVCAVGLVLHVWLRRRMEPPQHWRALGLIGLHIVLTLAAIVRWTMMTPASHGRLLFPAIAGMSLLMALGLSAIADWLRRLRLPTWLTQTPSVLAVGGMAALAAISPFATVLPAYTPPITRAMPANFAPVRQTLAPWAEVLGYQMEPADVRPGERVRVHVFMRALKAPQFNWSLVTNLYGRDNTPLARFDTFTGGGLLPSSEWQPGQTWVDVVEFNLPSNAVAPAVLRVQFGLYNAGSGEIAPSLDANGNAGAPLYDGSTLLPLESPPAANPFARFGTFAQLTAAEITQPSADTRAIKLGWRTMARAPADYSVFVHVVDSAGKLVAQQDAPTLSGQFPATRWQPNVAFDETRTIALPSGIPAGRYTVLMGLYDPQTGARLEAFDAHGTRAPDDALVVGTVEVHR